MTLLKAKAFKPHKAREEAEAMFKEIGRAYEMLTKAFSGEQKLQMMLKKLAKTRCLG